MVWSPMTSLPLPSWVVRKVGPSLGPAVALTLVTSYLRYVQVSSRRKREAESQSRISKARELVQDELPELHLLVIEPADYEPTAEIAEQFAASVEKLSQIFDRSGQDLREALGGAAERATDGIEADEKAVAELCCAWCEVGEAKCTLSAQLLELTTSLRQLASEAHAERAKRQAEAVQLQEALVSAQAECPVMQPSSRRAARLFGGVEPAPELEKIRLQRLEELRASTAESFEDIAEELSKARQRGAEAVAKAVAEVRRLAKPMGEKVVRLQPCGPSRAKDAIGDNKEKDAETTAAGKPARQQQSPRKMGELVKKLSQTMVTAEGRQTLRDAEAKENAVAEEEARKSPPKKEVEHLSSPVDQISDTVWRLRGLYEHQILKIGLRALDQEWPAEELHKFPRAKDGGCLLFRERLFLDMLKATIRLQSITGNDIAAAQRDLPHLSLRQLLRLRVLHLDFTPSGAGADTVTGVGGTHEAFLTKLDSMLFRQLGCKAAGLPASSGSPLDASEEHRLGRDAVLMVSAARALPSPNSWCWWLTDHRRVFFDVCQFKSAETFPVSSGVLEVTDLSKADRHEPTGKLRWFDWRAELIREESKLSAFPLRGGLVPKSVDLDNEAIDREPLSPTSPTTPHSRSPTKSASSLAAGAATAAMMSPELLKGKLGSLRKTGTLDLESESAVEPGVSDKAEIASEVESGASDKPQLPLEVVNGKAPTTAAEDSQSPKRKQTVQQGPPSGIGLSADVLSSMRGSLRKTGSAAAAEAAAEPSAEVIRGQAQT